MIADLSPGLILIAGALLLPLLRGRARAAFMLALPVIAAIQLAGLPHGTFGEMEIAELSLTTLRVDRLSVLFGLIFLIAAFLGLLYALHLKDTVQHVAALLYAGSAIGAVFAGDLMTLFIFWEGAAFASVVLIWASRSERAYRAGLRYLLMQAASGVLLLAGIIMHHHSTGSLAFEHFGLDTLAGRIIFVAFGIKCAFPLLHSWLQDAYPEGTVTGTVLLSAFTTKMAVYALARGYAGTELLVPIGATMAAFPIFYAVIENDLRRVLAYSLNNQLGFMVVGIGIGTELALNGAMAHVFADVVFKGLLFMSMGAVLFRVGTVNGSDLGGLYKSMPWTTAFCIVGAASISAFPLFSAFVTKAMIITAAMQEGYFWTWIILLFASAGVFHHAGIKIPYFAFFAHDSGKRCAEAPGNMLMAMAASAALCILIGVFPSALYALLPYPVDYVPYTLEHGVTQLQLLLFSALAFAVLMRTGIYPPELRSTNLDVDWLYRRICRQLATAIGRVADAAWEGTVGAATRVGLGLAGRVRHYCDPSGMLASNWPTGQMAFWTTAMLAAYLLLSTV